MRKMTDAGKRTALLALVLALAVMPAVTGCDSGAAAPAETGAAQEETSSAITVTLDFNGSGEEAQNITCEAGEAVTLPKAEYEGYEFLGWLDADGTVSNGSYLVSGSTTLTAQWEKLYALKFDGTDESSYLKAGSAVGSIPEAAEKAGTVFCGWNDDASGAGTYYTKDNTMPETDVTLYAVYKNAVTLTFDETSPVASVLLAEGEKAGDLLPNPSNNGFAFLGWNTAQDGSGTAVNADTVVSGDMQLYAQWTEGAMLYFGNELDISGAKYNTKNDSGSSGASLPTISFANETVDFTVIGDNVFLSVPAKRMKLTPDHTYRITYDFTVNGEDSDATRMTVMPYNAKGDWGADCYVENAVSGTEYTVNADYPNVCLRPGATGVSVDDAVRYSHIYVLDITEYEGASMPTLGGKEVTARCAAVGAAVGELPVMEREGYTFTGWNTAKDGSGETYTASTVMGADDVQLWPQWTKN